CSDTAASVTPSSAAARLTDPRRTTAAKARSWLGVTPPNYRRRALIARQRRETQGPRRRRRGQLVLRQYARTARGGTQPVLAQVDVDVPLAARHQVGRMLRGVEVLAGPAAHRQLERRRPFDAYAAVRAAQLGPAHQPPVAV